MSGEAESGVRGGLAGALGVALRVGAGLFFLAYPFLIWFGLQTWSVRTLGIVLLALLIPSTLLRMATTAGRALRETSWLPWAIGLLFLLSALVDDHRFMLVMPVLVNGALLASFAGTLRRGPPMVERFARLYDPDLPEPEVRYCRSVTVAWCVFFVANGAIAGALALFAPLSWWTAFAGGISYGLIGLMFTAEYLIRKWRFRRYGDRLHDHVLRRIFPPKTPAEPDER